MRIKTKVIAIIMMMFLASMVFNVSTVKAAWWGEWSISYPSSITVGSSATVAVTISPFCSMHDLHVLFKGYFEEPSNYWTSHWTYEEQVISVSADGTYEFIFTIPYDLYVESLAGSGTTYRFMAKYYYFYVFTTTPGGEWGTGNDNKGPHYTPGAGGSSTATVIYPTLDYHKLLTTAIGMIKVKISPPPNQPDTFGMEVANERLRKTLLRKLDEATKLIHSAYISGKLISGKLIKMIGAAGILRAFIIELSKAAPHWSKTGECIDLATFIIGWIKAAILAG